MNHKIKFKKIKMDSKYIDYTKKENQTFKNFFKVMWSDSWIQTFVGFFTVLVIQLFHIEWCIESWLNATDSLFALVLVSLGLMLPISVTIILIFKIGQFWMDLKNNRSR